MLIYHSQIEKEKSQSFHSLIWHFEMCFLFCPFELKSRNSKCNPLSTSVCLPDKLLPPPSKQVTAAESLKQEVKTDCSCRGEGKKFEHPPSIPPQTAKHGHWNAVDNSRNLLPQRLNWCDNSSAAVMPVMLDTSGQLSWTVSDCGHWSSSTTKLHYAIPRRISTKGHTSYFPFSKQTWYTN